MGFGNPQKLMKQMQKMQADMARLQDQLGDMTVEATAGGGAVLPLLPLPLRGGNALALHLSPLGRTAPQAQGQRQDQHHRHGNSHNRSPPKLKLKTNFIF